MIIEACVETTEQAVDAEKRGADRLEFCSRLDLDGLSPDIELIERVLSEVSIPIKIMVRPRSGNFIYSEEELNEMIQYCTKCSHLPIDGFVTGMLTAKRKIDVINLTRLLANQPHHTFTFHKAIDLVGDPIRELKRCSHLKNLTHVLTSGQASTAMEGIPVIREMVASLEPTFKIIAAGKITPYNINEIKAATNAEEFHGRNILK